MPIESNRLLSYRDVWNTKKVLRRLYHSYYELIAKQLNQGVTLEIGGGCGNIKDYLGTQVVSIDIQYSSNLDMVADAQFLPFKKAVFNNIVLFDVLHHLQNTDLFFNEAQRVLKPGGRVIMIEPGITPLSYIFYKYFHEEPVDMKDNSFWQTQALAKLEKDPYDSNQAIPTLLFKKHMAAFKKCYPCLRPITVSWLSLWAFPLSGGYKRWSLIPAIMIKPLLAVEKVVMPLLGRVCAFRLFVILERES